MIPYKQLSLADIFQDCQNKFNNDRLLFMYVQNILQMEKF